MFESNREHANSTVLNILEFSNPLLQQCLNVLLARLDSGLGFYMVFIRSIRSERPLIITTSSIGELPIIIPRPKLYIIDGDRSLRLLRVIIAGSAPLQFQGDIKARSLLTLPVILSPSPIP